MLHSETWIRIRGLAVRGVEAQKKEWSEKCMEEKWKRFLNFNHKK